MLIICFRYRFLDEYPAEPFTEVYWIKFQRINSARYCRYKEVLPGGGESHVSRLNFKLYRVSVYKCLLLIVGFAFTVAIWPREVVSCHDFILRAVTTFWAMSLVGIYAGRAFTKSVLLDFMHCLKLVLTVGIQI